MFVKKRLSNGITLLFEKRNLPVVSVSISNPFGASHETQEIKGIAHFIEHLLFTGTKKRNHEQISKEIEKRGGVLNAFTSQDVTSFWFKLPAEHLFFGLDILTDMLNNAEFPENKFEKEKKVIIEEIKMYHDNPQYQIHDNILNNLYHTPFGTGIIGSDKTINSLSRDFVKKYFQEKYYPGNYIVTIVGNADIKKVTSYLEKEFKKKEGIITNLPIKKKNSHNVEKRKGIDQAHFMFAFHAPEATSHDKYALEVLDAWLTNGMSSELFLKIREERGLAYAVKGSISMEKNYSYYTIYAGTRKEAIPEVKKLILEGLQKAKKMSPGDLKDAKSRLIGLKKISSEESTNVMNELLFSELSTGNAKEFYDYEKEISKVTLSQIKNMADIKEYSTTAIVPE